MLTAHVALVSETDAIAASDLATVSAALQKQVTRDFGPLWDVDATVDAFASLDDMPTDYWPVIISDTIDAPGALGYHKDENGQPLSLVLATENWPLTVSHEILEMLADPFGNRAVAGAPPPQATGPAAKLERVNYLLEVCDPCESMDYAYTVNGIAVSDFLTPHYFDPTTSGGVRYSYSGAIAAPKQVLPGGYLTWMDPIETRWYQAQYFNGEFAVAGPFDWRRGSSGSWRSVVDAQTRQPSVLRGPVASTRITASARSRTLRSASVVLAAKANAARLSADIESLSLRIAQNEAGTLVARRRKRKS